MLPCDTAPMDTAHLLLQDCPLQDISRSEEAPPEGEAGRRPCGPEEDGAVRASHWRGRPEKAIEEGEGGQLFHWGKSYMGQ